MKLEDRDDDGRVSYPRKILSRLMAPLQSQIVRTTATIHESDHFGNGSASETHRCLRPGHEPCWTFHRSGSAWPTVISGRRLGTGTAFAAAVAGPALAVVPLAGIGGDPGRAIRMKRPVRAEVYVPSAADQRAGEKQSAERPGYTHCEHSLSSAGRVPDLSPYRNDPARFARWLAL
jgi:hypothetical protein